MCVYGCAACDCAIEALATSRMRMFWFFAERCMYTFSVLYFDACVPVAVLARNVMDVLCRHVIHGKDADLIMLCLATHEPRFSILRELDLNPRERKMNAEQLKSDHKVRI